MKKSLFVLLAVLCTATVASAQKIQKLTGGSLSTEIHYTPSVGGDNNVNSLSMPAYGLKLRYHLNEKFVAKLSLGYDSYGNKETNINPDDDNKSFEKHAENTFTFAPGVEYHFTKYETISPYIGAQIGFSTGSTKEREWTSYNNDYVRSRTPLFKFIIGATAGVDIYLCKGLYTGVELGLGYENIREGKGKTVISNDGNTTTLDGTTINSRHNFGFYAVPSIRFGWHF